MVLRLSNQLAFTAGLVQYPQWGDYNMMVSVLHLIMCVVLVVVPAGGLIIGVDTVESDFSPRE